MIDRPILPLCLVALLGLAPAAWAQGQTSPLGDCRKSFFLGNLGPADGDSQAGSISGAVRFLCDGTWIFAEEISWDEHTLVAKGDLLVMQDGLRVNADRMEMDRQTRLGTFYNAYGTARLTDRAPDKNLFGSMEAEVMFRAEKLERIGPRTYRLTHGMFSTCVQATPRWQMTGSSGTVILDDHALLKNVMFRVKGVPVLYFPYLYYPMKKDDRSTGFLIPTYSSSVVRGQGLSNAFFWAINRSQDATLYYDWFSKAGQGVGADYRFVSAPGSRGDARVYVLDEKERLAADGTVERVARRSYDLRGSINQSLGRYFRLIGRANYFSDAATQQLYQQNVFDLSQRDRYVGLTLAGNVNRFRVTALLERRDVFTGLTTSQRSGRAPQINVSVGETSIGGSRVYVGASGEVAYLETRPDATQPQLDRTLWRMDGVSTVRSPLSRLPFLSLTTTASWRLTRWLESLDALTGSPVPVPITRSLIDLRADMVGPVAARVFQTPKNGYAERFKHLIEPRLSVRWLSPFDQFNQVILTDQVDRQVGGTTSVSYSLANRVLARVRTAGGEARVREVLSVGVGQSYYSNALAGAFDPQYPTGSIGTFSPIQITASITPTDEVSGRFQMYIDSAARAVRSYSASAAVTRPRLQVSAGWSKRQYLPGVPGFDNPTGAFHFLNANATVRASDGRVSGSYGVNFDVKNGRFLQQRIVAYYSAQCCGISVDYQTVNIAQFGLAGVQNDRRFAISFTLAGIGSFSPPLGAFGR